MVVFISQRQILHLSLKYYSITQYLQVWLYTCWQKVLQLGWLIVLSVVIALICLLYNSKSNDRLCMIQENGKTQSYQSNWKWNSFTIETQRYINKRTHNLTAQKKPQIIVDLRKVRNEVPYLLLWRLRYSKQINKIFYSSYSSNTIEVQINAVVWCAMSGAL